MLLAFGGSLRRDSLNHRLAMIAADEAEKLGATVKRVRLHDYALPLFNQDLEDEQVPDGVFALKDDLIGVDGFLIASPEYNGFFSAALKNALDWASRPREHEAPMACFKGKVAGLLAASPGALGGLRALPHLRLQISNLGAHVVPPIAAIGSAHSVLSALTEGSDDTALKRILPVVHATVHAARVLGQ